MIQTAFPVCVINMPYRFIRELITLSSELSTEEKATATKGKRTVINTFLKGYCIMFQSMRNSSDPICIKNSYVSYYQAT